MLDAAARIYSSVITALSLINLSHCAPSLSDFTQFALSSHSFDGIVSPFHSLSDILAASAALHQSPDAIVALLRSKRDAVTAFLRTTYPADVLSRFFTDLGTHRHIPSALTFVILRLMVQKDIKIYPISRHDIRKAADEGMSGKSLVHGLLTGFRGTDTHSKVSSPYFRLGNSSPTSLFYSVLCINIYLFYWPTCEDIALGELQLPDHFNASNAPPVSQLQVRIPNIESNQGQSILNRIGETSDSDSVSPMDDAESVNIPIAVTNSDTQIEPISPQLDSPRSSSSQRTEEDEPNWLVEDPLEAADIPVPGTSNSITIGDYLTHFQPAAHPGPGNWPCEPKITAHHLGYSGQEQLCLRLTSAIQLRRIRTAVTLHNTADVDSVVCVTTTSLLSKGSWTTQPTEAELTIQPLFGECIQSNSVGSPVSIFGNEPRQLGQYSNFKFASVLSQLGTLSLFAIDNTPNSAKNRASLRQLFYSELKTALKDSSWLAPPLSSLLSVYELGHCKSTGRDRLRLAAFDLMKASPCILDRVLIYRSVLITSFGCQSLQILSSFATSFTVVVRSIDCKGITCCRSLIELGDQTLQLNAMLLPMALDLIVDFGVNTCAKAASMPDPRLFFIPIYGHQPFPCADNQTRIRVYPHLGNGQISGRSVTFKPDQPLPMGVSKARCYLHDLEAGVRRARVGFVPARTCSALRLCCR